MELPVLRISLGCPSTFEDDPVDLRGLPNGVVQRAREVIKALKEGADYRQFQGKKLSHMEGIVRVPLPMEYRLVCRWRPGQLEFLAVLSHEAYNGFLRK